MPLWTVGEGDDAGAAGAATLGRAGSGVEGGSAARLVAAVGVERGAGGGTQLAPSRAKTAPAARSATGRVQGVADHLVQARSSDKPAPGITSLPPRDSIETAGVSAGALRAASG